MTFVIDPDSITKPRKTAPYRGAALEKLCKEGYLDRTAHNVQAVKHPQLYVLLIALYCRTVLPAETSLEEATAELAELAHDGKIKMNLDLFLCLKNFSRHFFEHAGIRGRRPIQTEEGSMCPSALQARCTCTHRVYDVVMS